METNAGSELGESVEAKRTGGRFETAGVGLSGLLALYVLLTIGAGIAFKATQLPGDELHRIGFVSASAIDLRLGLGLVVAAALVAATTASALRQIGVVTIMGTAAVATLLSLLAVRAQLHQLDLRNVEATSAFYLSQATYLVGTIGPMAVAVVLAAGRRSGRR